MKAKLSSQVLTTRRGRRTLKAMGTLGTFIRRKREKLGLGLLEAAAAWGMTQGSLSMIERGERTKPQSDTLIKLARGLGITIDELLGEATGRNHGDGRTSGTTTATTS